MRVGHGRGGDIGRGWPCSGGSALWRRRGRAERGTAACGGADRRPCPISCGERDCASEDDGASEGDGEDDGAGATSARAERGERERRSGEGSRPGAAGEKGEGSGVRDRMGDDGEDSPRW